jgi:Helix-turn-helix domain
MTMMKGGEPPLFDWGALVPRIVHPAQVAIVEAMFWIGQPLSATELRDLFDEPACYYLSLVSYHLGKLEEVGAVRETGNRTVRGATETFYFFPPSPNGKAAK